MTAIPAISLLIVRPDPAISRVLTRDPRVLVRLLDLGDDIGLDRVTLRLHVHAVNPRGIQAEDLRFHFLGQLGITELLAELVADLEALEGIDGPLRRSPPQAVGAPD